MPEIRKLTPSVGRIRLPDTRSPDAWHAVRPGGLPRPIVVVRRTRKDHPSPTPQPTPCVLWQGRLDSHGYGMYGNKKMHRWVLEQVLNRKLGPRNVVLHACDNPLCYRFDHLSIGTIQDNNADMKRKGRAKPPPRNTHLRGEKHPRAKITQRQVDTIRALYHGGYTQATIAGMVGISKSQVSKICNGVNWRAAPRKEEK